jgi:hypothetical protein
LIQVNKAFKKVTAPGNIGSPRCDPASREHVVRHGRRKLVLAVEHGPDSLLLLHPAARRRG